jgi:hypothetical protein
VPAPDRARGRGQYCRSRRTSRSRVGRGKDEVVAWRPTIFSHAGLGYAGLGKQQGTLRLCARHGSDCKVLRARPPLALQQQLEIRFDEDLCARGSSPGPPRDCVASLFTRCHCARLATPLRPRNPLHQPTPFCLTPCEPVCATDPPTTSRIDLVDCIRLPTFEHLLHKNPKLGSLKPSCTILGQPPGRQDRFRAH